MIKIIKKDDFIKKNNNLVFREGNKQVLVLGIGDKIFALDNRCPHEGYPLSQGNTDKKSCVLTCNWHNWKFDLETGKCLVGGDNVRTYPVTNNENEILIDLNDPTPEEIKANVIEGFEVAFKKRQYGRISREISRLIFNDIDPLYAVQKAILWSFEKLEFGTTHSYAALADWINLYQKSEKIEDKVICLTEGIDHLAFDSLRQPCFPYSKDIVTYTDDELLEAIEAENRELAESMIHSFFNGDKRYSDLEEVFSKAALAHYNDFGHSLIYVNKCLELSETFDNREIDKALALTVVRSLCYTTKEDLLPEFKNYSKTLEAMTNMRSDTKRNEGIILSRMNVSQSYNWLLENYSKFEVNELYDALLKKNAENLLQFNLNFQAATINPVTQNVGWLDFTHAITFSNAVRKTCERYPQLWPSGLLQIISFYGRNSSYLDEINNMDSWRVKSLDKFKSEVREIILDHGLSDPIYSAHIIKTAIAVFEECENSSEGSRDLLLASLSRYLQSPLKQKHVRRTALQGIALVSKDFKLEK